MQTIKNLFEEQNTKALTQLEKMLAKPGIYLGTIRFDYLYEFMNGYVFNQFEQSMSTGNQKSMFDMMPDAILQYWILRTQIAALSSGELHARTLFWRCFGTKAMAFEQYNSFINYPYPMILASHSSEYAMASVQSKNLNAAGCVSNEISCYEKKNNLVRYDWEDSIPADFYDNMAISLITDVEAIAKNSILAYDRFRIYIRREPLFIQVRFLFHLHDGWHDDIEIISKYDNSNEIYELLIGILAKARNCQTDALIKAGCEIFDYIDYSNNIANDEISDLKHLITDEKTFHKQYLFWKSSIEQNG